MTPVHELEAGAMLFAGAVSVSALATPVAIRVALRTGLIDRPAEHKFHRRPTPYLGGIAVGLPVLCALVAVAAAVPGVRFQLSAMALGATGLAGVGLLDDRRPLGAAPRIAVECVAALGLWASGIRVPVPQAPLISLVLTVLAVVALTNAVNLLDNMDGLTAGTAAMASLTLAATAASQGQGALAIVAIVLAGGCLGFLPYNFSPARIFLGDAGAMLIGFLLAAMLIGLRLSSAPPVIGLMAPAMIAGVPLFDTALVVFSRWRRKRPVFRGGTDHFSHRLAALGLRPATVALATYAAAAGSGALALVLIRTASPRLAWLLAAAALALVAGLILALEAIQTRMTWAMPRRGSGQPTGRPDARRPAVGRVPAAAGDVRR